MTTITLDHPPTIDGKEVKSLELRRAKVKDMREASKAGNTDAELEMTLFARLTGMNPEDLEELDMADYGKLQREYTAFLSGAGRS